jgi:hypothetical protein
MTRTAVLLGRLVLALTCAATHALGEDGKAGSSSIPATNAPVMELKGQLVRLSGKSNERVGFKTEQGAVYLLVSNHMSSALFLDTNLLGKTLVLKGRESPETNSFEVTGNLRSSRGGKIHELYYYCDICSIEGIDPGPCMCCRDPVHLVEEPPK